MKLTKRVLGVAVVVAAGVVGPGAGPLGAQGATVVDCAFIDPDLGGRIVFTPDGGFLGNCWEHTVGGAEPTGGSAAIVDCDEALETEGTIGIQVITPQGNVYTNCHIHG